MNELVNDGLSCFCLYVSRTLPYPGVARPLQLGERLDPGQQLCPDARHAALLLGWML